MQTTLNLATVYDVIDYINDHAKTAVERGTWCERAVVFYLRHDPDMCHIMGDVRLCVDAPTNDGHDTGIDVVCKNNGSVSDDAMRRCLPISTRFHSRIIGQPNGRCDNDA